MKIDIERLTLGDLEAIEEASGKPLGELYKRGQPTAALLVGAVYAGMRRDNPDVTWEDAKNVRFDELDMDDDADPT